MKVAAIKELLEARRARVPIALVSELESGAQRLVRFNEAGGDELADQLRRGFRFDESRVVTVNEKEYFIAIHNPPLKLVVIGAVHIAQALIPIATGLNYDVVVIDPRGAFATPDRFPGVTVRAEWPDDVLPQIGLDMRSGWNASRRKGSTRGSSHASMPRSDSTSVPAGRRRLPLQ